MKYQCAVMIISGLLMNSVAAVSQVETIPFELQENGHVILNVQVNDDSRTLNFLLDTGASSDLLDMESAKSLGLESDHQASVQGTGGSTTYDMVLNQKLIVDDKVEVSGTHLVLMDLDRLSRISEKKIDGIIGYSLLRKYVTKLDYGNEELLLYERISDVDLNGYEHIPFEMGGGIPIPQFDVTIRLTNGEVYSDKIIFDSGASLTLLVNSPFNKANKLSEKAVKRVLSRMENMAKQSIIEEIAIQSISIGDLVLKDLPVQISSDEAGISSRQGYMGLLGAEVIKRFNVILDYSEKMIYLKPNKGFEDKFDYPLSSIKLANENGKVVIYSIDESTSAFELGLRSGDQVISINDISGDLKTYNTLLKKEGETIDLELLKPHGEKVQIRLKLERLI